MSSNRDTVGSSARATPIAISHATHATAAVRKRGGLPRNPGFNESALMIADESLAAPSAPGPLDLTDVHLRPSSTGLHVYTPIVVIQAGMSTGLA